MIVSEDQTRFNSFQEAVRDGTKDEVNELVSCDAFPIDFESPTGRRPVHLVAERGALSALQCLVDTRKCNMLAEDKKGATALHYAAKAGSVACVEYLLSRGAPPSGIPGDTAPENQTNRETALHWAVWSCNFDVAKLLHNADPTLVSRFDRDGDTLVHWACSNGRLSVLRKLVNEFGADVNLRNASRSTALHCAVENGDKEMVVFLVDECRSDVNAQDSSGDTPLHVAVSFEAIDAVKVLLAKPETDVRIKNHAGQTPLDVARDLRVSGGIEALLEAAADGSYESALLTLHQRESEARKLAAVIEAAKRAGAK